MTSSDRVLRDRVIQMSPASPARAIELAKRIVDPWYRCQALAHVAHETSDLRQKKRFLRRAFAAAAELSDLNRKVTVSAWPLKVLCHSPGAGDLTAETERLLHSAREITSPVQRADALNLVLGSLLEASKPLFVKALQNFTAACCAPLASGGRNKKGDALLVPWIAIVDRLDRALARELLESLSSSASRKRASAALKDSQHLSSTDLCTWPNIARD